MSMGARTKPNRQSAKIVVPAKGSTGGTGPATFDGRENMRAPKNPANKAPSGTPRTLTRRA